MKKTDEGVIIPETKSEKLKILKDARAKLEEGFTKHAWVKVIDGAASYCLYGAIQAAMHVPHEKIAEEILEKRVDDLKFYEPKELEGKSPLEVMSYIEAESEETFYKYDTLVSSCSITETLFNAARPMNSYALLAMAMEKQDWVEVRFQLSSPKWNTWYEWQEFNNRHGNSDPALKDFANLQVMWLKTRALQEINDREGREAVLAVIDKAIEDLKRK